MSARSTFSYVHDVEVRFRDLDSLGHVHHSLALMYFEEARAAFWRNVAKRPTVQHIDYVIGSASIKYLQRVRYPGVLSVGVRVPRVGGKSIDLAYEARSPEGDLLITGETTIVMFDFIAGKTKEVDEDLKEALARYA